MSKAYADALFHQAQAADPAASVFVTANAGSGKTKVLIDRVARLLLAGGAPSSFLCITYTKAAAAEMQRRLFERLGGWCVMEDEKLRDELRTLLGDDAALDLPRARALFARALETPGGLRIQTIHAFAERLLRRFPLEAGVAPGFEILDEPRAKALIGTALARVAEKHPDALAHFGQRLYSEHFTQLLDAVAARRAPFVAGEEALLRARHGAVEERETFVTAFRDAIPWRDLRTACETLRASGRNDQKCAALIAAAHAADEDDFLDAYYDIFLTDKGEPRANVITAGLAGKHPALARLFADEQARVILFAAKLRAIERTEDARALLALARGLLDAYGTAKHAIGMLDFDDLIERAQTLLSRTDSASWVLYKLDGGIDHILIDEGQDTSPAQWDLIAPLQAEFFSGAAARETTRTVFAVGDPKQSIYSFQGADPARFLDELQKLSSRVAAADRVFVAPQLKMSFRSTQTVLDAVDATFANLPLAGDTPGEGDRLEHFAWREGKAGLVEWWPIPAKPARKEPRAWDAPLDQESGVTATGVLANTLAAAVKGWIDSGEAVWTKDGKRHPMHAGDVLILVRKRGAVFEDVLRALKNAGLPVAGADRMVVAAELAVEDLLALARVALDPEDDLSLASALRGPFVGISEDELMVLASGRAKGVRLIERLRKSSHTEAKDYIAALIAQRDVAPYEFLARILEGVDKNGASGWNNMFARLGYAARDPAEELLSRAQAIGERGAPTLQHLIAAIETDSAIVKREMEGAGDAVRVMTAHGAKGLESPVVILADTTGGFEERNPTGLILHGGQFYWSPRKSDDDVVIANVRQALTNAAYKEHLRLLYVAMTRARDRLIVCGHFFGHPKGSGREDTSWHKLVEDGLKRAGAAECDTPFGKGLRLGAPLHAEKTKADKAAPFVPPDWLRKPAPVEKSAEHALAPSRLHPEEPPAFAARGRQRDRFRRGRLVHGLLERLPDIDPGVREAAAKSWLKARGVKDKEAQALAKEALNVISDAAFAAAFASGSRAETPIVGVLPNGRQIAGVIDRLAITGDSILAVDFKTDRPAPKDPAAIPAAYVAQLAAYAAALESALPGRTIRCAILWTEAPALIEIPPARLAAARAALS
ncbi:MAG TPA: double-strand break repair helicase AddA [Caulobacterales bacterium]|nr:double-strand break repair helicase AddA [Caulobacterales bacterium]